MFLSFMFSERPLLQITSRLASETLRKVINIVCENERKLKPAAKSTCLIAGCCFSKRAEKSSLSSVKYTKLFSDYLPTHKHVGESNSQQYSEITESSPNKNTENCCIHQDTHIEKSDVDNVNPCKIKQDHKSLKRKSQAQVEQPTVAANVQIIPSEVRDENVLKQKKRKLDKQKRIGLSKELAEKRQKPNYFVAVQISDPGVHRALQEVQNHIVLQDKRFESAIQEVESLHITLMVMHISDTETHARALKALENVYREYEDSMVKEPLTLEFKGLAHFQNRVLYAKLSMGNSYERLIALVESVNKHFAAESIYATDKRACFTPHLTIAKLNFHKKAQRQIKKFHLSLYCDYENQYFGQQTVQSIQLLSMTDKDESGYYRGNELFFGSFIPPADHSALSSVLAIGEKKMEVKGKIHALTKKLLQAETC